MEKKISRGIRNNNPGNIRLSNDPWQGLAEVQNDKEFFQFKSMAYGIRAIARTLITYQDKYNIRTIKKMAERYAPAADNNDTVDYYMKVCAVSGIYNHDKVLNFHKYEDLEPVIRGIIYKENAPDHLLVKQADINKGLSLAGVEPPQKPLVKSRTMQGASIAAISGISLAIEAINNTAERVGNWYPWLGTLIMLGGLGYVFYARTSDHKRGK